MNYLVLLCICAIIGIFLQIKYKIHLYHSFKEELYFIIALLIIMIPMDIYAVKNGIWGFSEDKIIGIKFLGLPIEEYFFVLVVSYFILMVYKTIDKKFK